MRKLFIIASAILLACSPIYAQDDPGTGEGLSSGDVLIEITGSPFNGNSLLNYGSTRLRVAVSDRIVPRLGFNLGGSSAQVTQDVVSSTFYFDLRPGVEYHTTSEGSFRSYIALDVILGSMTAELDSKDPGTPSVVGATSVPQGVNSYVSNRGYFRYGGFIGFGADYHFTSRFYIGAEIGVNVYVDKNAQVSMDGVMIHDHTNGIYTSVNTQNSFRVGFKLF